MTYHRQPAQSGALVSIGILAGLLVFGYILLSFVLGYWLEPVGSTQVAIQFQGNRAVNVVGPGLYTDLSPFADLRRIETRELPFVVSDDEVLTKDQQRIGVTASGTVRRPGLERGDVLLENWGRFSIFYTDDAALIGSPAKDKEPAKDGLIQSLGKQATKVCVGDLEFSKAVVGSARDILRECIAKEMNDLTAGYALQVNNVVVPNVALGEAVQKAMDAITASRFQESLAAQQKITAESEAQRLLAVERGKILVEQGRVQEETRQAATTAGLQQARLLAERSVIEQEKANEQFSAERNLEIARVNRQVAEETARVATAPESARAAMFQTNPAYAQLQRDMAYAAAWSKTDKVIVDPNANVVQVLGGNATPIVNTGR